MRFGALFDYQALQKNPGKFPKYSAQWTLAKITFVMDVFSIYIRRNDEAKFDQIWKRKEIKLINSGLFLNGS